MKKIISILLCISITIALLCISITITLFSRTTKKPNAQIIISSNPTEMEQYASLELQRYLFALSGELLPIVDDSSELNKNSFILGQSTNKAIEKLVLDKKITLDFGKATQQAYKLKTLAEGKNNILVMAGVDEVGTLYSVYGLLDDYYGVGFNFSGDILPDTQSPITIPNVDEVKSPKQEVRGVLPWTNFLQSATVYSLEDYKFIIDQMTKMRMNLLNLHNYNYEMLHSFEYNGVEPRTFMNTANIGHSYSMYGFDVNKYLFGARDLFDDYDFSTDATLHNDGLLTADVNDKGRFEFEKVVEYAHTRGVRICLGMDIDTAPSVYGTPAGDSDFVTARIDDIMTKYPTLDYFAAYRSEGLNQGGLSEWDKVFSIIYDRMKEKNSKTRLAISGWGIKGDSIANIPNDVIIAPIADYTSGFVSGEEYGKHEYWGGPWAQRDFTSSVYYYPYDFHLDGTIEAYQNSASNMNGLFMLAWPITDATASRLSYIAKAPWDNKNKYKSADMFYKDFATEFYGETAAKTIVDVINNGEPFANDYSESQPTNGFYRLLINYSNGSDYETACGLYLNGERVMTLKFPTTGGWETFKDIEIYMPNTTKDGFKFVVDEEDFVENKGVAAANISMIVMHGWHDISSPEKWTLEGCAVTSAPGTAANICIANFGDNVGDNIIFPNFKRDIDLKKADSTLLLVNNAIKNTPEGGNRNRLEQLRNRIDSVKNYIELENEFGYYKWEDLSGKFPLWARNFINRVDDISSLGTVVSTQNRWVQEMYVTKENKLRAEQTVKSPSNVTAKGTAKGAIITWVNQEMKGLVNGFAVYRDGVLVNKELLSAGTTAYTDTFDGETMYQVRAVSSNGESPLSVGNVCEAGKSDNTPPKLVVISPPTSLYTQQSATVKVRFLDNRDKSALSGVLKYRYVGDEKWSEIPLEHRANAVFTADIQNTFTIKTGVLSYYIEVSDGTNKATYPQFGEKQPATIVIVQNPVKDRPIAPTISKKFRDNRITWMASKDAYLYKIYRSENDDFTSNGATYLTFVGKNTLYFSDTQGDFEGNVINNKPYYYCVIAVDILGNESVPSDIVEARFNQKIQICSIADTNTAPVKNVVYADGRVLENCEGEHTRFANVTFDNITNITVVAGSGNGGGVVEVWLDGFEGVGKKVTDITINGGGYEVFVPHMVNVAPINGKHDLVLRYHGNGMLVQAVRLG
jgi:hypothetical protein